MGFPGASVVKNPLANAGDAGLNAGSVRFPGEGSGNPLQFFLPGISNGQRSLGYTPWGHKKSNMTWWLHNNFQKTITTNKKYIYKTVKGKMRKR